MDITTFMATDIFRLIVIPILIFLSRIIDVSIGTLRVIFISKGYKIISPILGFIEVMIWLVAIQQIMSNLGSIYTYLAYGLGFATGTYVGMLIEEKIQVGKIVIRVIVKKNYKEMLTALNDAKFHVTTFEGINTNGKVRLLFAVIKRQKSKKFIDIVNSHNRQATYTIQDVRYAYEEPTLKGPKKSMKRFGFIRKAK